MKYVNIASKELSQYVPLVYCDAMLFTGENADEVIAFLKPRIAPAYFKTPPKVEIIDETISEFGWRQVKSKWLVLFDDFNAARENQYVLISPPLTQKGQWGNLDKDVFESEWEPCESEVAK